MMNPNTKPVGPYEDFAACVAANQDKDDPEAYCAAIENESADPAKVAALSAKQALLDTLAKDPKSERRYVGAVIKNVDKEEMEADIVLNNNSIDRDKEVVEPSGVTLPKPRRVPLVSSHQYGDLRKHIGDVPRIVKTKEEITARPRWFAGMGNAEADWAFELAKMGVAAFSIGFLPMEWEDADITDEKVLKEVMDGVTPLRRYTKWELAEVSQVIVPSNRGAVQRMIEAGILQKDFTMPGIKDEPMSKEAQAAFDKALESWKKESVSVTVQVDVAEAAAQAQDVAAAAATQEAQTESEVTKPRDQYGCEPGHHWNADTQQCEKDAEPKSVDIMALFESAARKEVERPSQRVLKEDKTGEADLKVIVDGAVKVAVEELKVSLEELRVRVLSETEAKINDVVAKAVRETFGPESAAHSKTKDLIAAVMTGVKEHVDRSIALARGNVDAWLK